MTDAKLTAPEALIFAMITISAVDREISDEELRRIGSIVSELPPFEGYNRDWLVHEAQACGKLLKKPDGLRAVLQLVKDTLPRRLYETAYVLAAEVAASDLQVREEEIRCLELLAEALGLDKLTCAALERAARARHQRV
ncbi:MAG: tellurite resistance TerB family protein [Hyphomicrobium sp.]|nr:tellurite resistance TerB family protein [Hyphomicrobium sp.]